MILQDFFRKNLKLTDDELVSRLLDAAKYEHLKKGRLLIEAGEVQTKLTFLLDGILRGFLVNEDGQETTDGFSCRYGEIVMGDSRLDAPSRISIEAIEDSILLVIPMETFTGALPQYPELWQLYTGHLTEALERHWEEKMLLRACSATVRYQWFLEAYPGLINQISNKYIASFLGITPVSLSRIRSQLREKEA